MLEVSRIHVGYAGTYIRDHHPYIDLKEFQLEKYS